MQAETEVRNVIESALGHKPLTYLIKNVELLNVFTGEQYPANIGIYRNRIVNVASKSEQFSAEQIIDGSGKIAIPGLIDTHLHIESTMLTPANFAAAVLPHGTTTVCADPHEIANVLGKAGVKMMLENAKQLPMKVYFFAPTCVPECNAVTAGAEITDQDIGEMLDWNGIVGLGEVMDFKGVISGNEKMMKILAVGRSKNAVIDGHCVFLSGKELNAYIAAGPEADHENFTVESAIEKLRSGMYLKLRGPHVLQTREMVKELTKLPKPWNIIFVTDDVMPDILKICGHLDYVCRTFIENGMDPVEAVRSVTLRPAEHMRFHDLGAIAPGKIADVVLLKSLEKFEVDTVISDGTPVVKNGKLIAPLPRTQFDPRAQDTVILKKLVMEDFVVKPPIKNGKLKLNVVDFASPNGQDTQLSFLQLVLTNLTQAEIDVRDGKFELGRIALVTVFERHGKSGGKGTGFVRNLIQHGAVASTVAHDAHNLIVVGTEPRDMYEAAKHVVETHGGIAAVKDGRLLASIELPIAGLMSNEDLELVSKKMLILRDAFKEMQMLDHPYMPLICLLTLSVVPHVRITDKGIFDVDNQLFANWQAS
ncbi:MAG: adenine deaminase [Candidatus Bathyarchaeia archaeon]